MNLAEYASALSLPPSRVAESLTVLHDAAMLELEHLGPEQVLITRVCPLARQVLPGRSCTLPTTAEGDGTFDEIVRRATAGP